MMLAVASFLINSALQEWFAEQHKQLPGLQAKSQISTLFFRFRVRIHTIHEASAEYDDQGPGIQDYSYFSLRPY